MKGDAYGQCYVSRLHDGPYHWYMWRDGYKGRTEHKQVLCESCAKNIGAWALPDSQVVLLQPEKFKNELKDVIQERLLTE